MDRIGEFLPFMLEGSVTTVQVFVLTLVISLPLGLPIALGSNSRFKPLSFLCKIYVWIFRGTPLMLQLLVVYFGPYYLCSQLCGVFCGDIQGRNKQHRQRTV